TSILNGVVRTGDVIDNFQAAEGDVDAATPVDAKNAPTGFGNLAQNARFPQRPHRSLFSWKNEEKNEEKISSNQLSTKSDQIQWHRASPCGGAPGCAIRLRSPTPRHRPIRSA